MTPTIVPFQHVTCGTLISAVHEPRGQDQLSFLALLPDDRPLRSSCPPPNTQHHRDVRAVVDAAHFSYNVLHGTQPATAELRRPDFSGVVRKRVTCSGWVPRVEDAYRGLPHEGTASSGGGGEYREPLSLSICRTIAGAI